MFEEKKLIHLRQSLDAILADKTSPENQKLTEQLESLLADIPDQKRNDSETHRRTDLLEDALSIIQETLYYGKPKAEIPQELAEYGILKDIISTLSALQQFAMSISRGELEQALPFKGMMAGSLKNLQANLLHLTWQTQQVAIGDFTQHVDFLGDFSEAFNGMVKNLACAEEGLRQSENRYRLLADEMKKAKEEAEAANRSKSVFLANMSHEIRTPMNSVLGFLSLVIEDPTIPEKQKQYLRTAYSSAESLLFLINDILDLSKLESGKFEIEQKPFNLYRTLQEALQTFDLKCRQKGLILSLKVHPALPPDFIGDSLRLRQIILNLVGNAVKFTEKGSITVTVTPMHDETIQHFLISDTGIGISANHLKKIFDPFTQADTSTARRFGGTGLGTTISKRLVEIMGGKIWVESQEGKGSRFHFTVSMKPVKGNEQSTVIRQPLPVEESQRRATRRDFKILLAEDIEVNILLARTRLKQLGHTVIEARNGIEAIEMFQKEKPDVILMDIQMPEMDGVEATKRIRQLEASAFALPSGNIKSKKVPIIALTASLMKEEQELFLGVGMNAVIGKPINFDSLFKLMESLVQGEKVGQESDTAGKNL